VVVVEVVVVVGMEEISTVVEMVVPHEGKFNV
jgi:hypothetical protein